MGLPWLLASSRDLGTFSISDKAREYLCAVINPQISHCNQSAEQIQGLLLWPEREDQVAGGPPGGPQPDAWGAELSVCMRLGGWAQRKTAPLQVATQ